jgi:uncharacterized delta-60 repeat protein
VKIYNLHRRICLGILLLAASTLLLRAAPVQITYDADGNIQQVGSSLSPAPAIVGEPHFAMGQIGGQASFSVVATSARPLSFQWFFNGSFLSGATANTLYLPSLTSNSFGTYTVVVSNVLGSVTSAPPATLYLDSNNNGIPDEWELAYFGSLNVPAYADSDSDGIPNIDEFLDGTDPTNSASSYFKLTVNNGVQVEPIIDLYPAGTSVTLTAPAFDGLAFNEWSGGLGGAHNPTTLVITSNTTVTALRGDPGLDPNWTPVFNADDGGVYCMATQPDHKVLVGGRFSEFDGRPAQNLVRLNQDGTLDTNFLSAIELGTTDNSSVSAMAVQPDGKIVLVGNFYTVDYFGRNNVARLNPDGSVDQTFNPGQGPNSTVFGVGLLSDGRIAIAGNFSQVDGINRGGVAVLDTNGALDQTFVPTNAFNSSIYNLAVQTGDRIIVSGAFTQYGSQPAQYVARLSTNAVLDSTFNPGGSGPNGYVQNTQVLSDGDLFCMGGFNKYNSTPGCAVLLDPNGNPQPNFTNTAQLNGRALCFLQDQSGGIILGGSFYYYGPTPAQYLARFNSDGSLDPTFNTTNAANRQIYSLATLTNGAVLAGGEFSTWSNAFQNRIVALNPATAAPLSTPSLNAAFRAEITQTLLQSNGLMMVAGTFASVNGHPAQRLARLTSSGSLDPNFGLTNPPNSTVDAITLQPDGNYLIGGSFNYCGAQYTPGLARFLPNGSLDPNFNIGNGFDGGVYVTAVQPGKGIVVGGAFTDCQGQLRPGLARLLNNGAVDNSFVGAIGGVNQQSGLDGTVYCITLQPDGKILIAGDFATVLGAPRLRVARLMADGQLDTTFNPGSGMDGTVSAMALQPDGEILLGGNFNYADGAYRPHLARLLSNGAVDLSYPNNNSGFNAPVFQVALQPDGSTYVVGDFNQVNGQYQNRCAHLFADGSVDFSFNPGTDLNDNVYTLATGTDGSVYLGGWVRQLYSQPRSGMLRLVTAPKLQVQFVGTQPGSLTPGQAVQLLATATSPNGVTGVRFEISADGSDFTPLDNGYLNQNSEWTGAWTPGTGTYYLRAVATDSEAQQQASLPYGPLSSGSTQTLPGYTAWVAANFSTADQANSAVSGEFADPNNDGVPNWLKFATGTPPNSLPTVAGGIWPIPGSPQYPTLSYRANLADTTTQFTVQVSTNLLTWSDGAAFTTLVDITPNGDGTETIRIRSNTPVGSGTAQFLRLVATPP